MCHRVVSGALVVALALAAFGVSVANAQPGPDDPPSPPTMSPAPPVVAAAEPKILLFTMGIGGLIWERHGHIALCVAYPDRPRASSVDCYNYGVGNFQEPLGMAWGFFRGTHSFWVAKDSPQKMFAIYQYTDRTIWQQEIPLTLEQKQKVIAKLEHDILEDNKHYAYDHFEDNCTTRIRNIIDDVTGGAFSSMKDLPTDGKTFRDLARDGFFGMPSMSRLSLLITDVAMGRSTDRVPDYYERMFLPQYLREAVEKKWGIKAKQVYVRTECRNDPDEYCASRGIRGEPEGPSGRGLFALFSLLITLPAMLAYRFGRYRRTALAVAVLPYALLGTILWVLAIISPLPYVRWNESLLVFLPLDVILLRSSYRHRETYAKARLAMLALFAALSLIDVLHQPLWPELLWALIPTALVALWPESWTRTSGVPQADQQPPKTRKHKTT